MALAQRIGDVDERARRRIARRLLPFLFIIYVIAILDRVNVSFAGLEMAGDLGFSDRVFGLGAGIFFIGYFLFEIPGALIVERWSARRWMARILVSWGIVTILLAFVHTPRQFYTARFFVGLAEAGFFPGIIVYLTHWFRYEDRARAVAIFMAAYPAANVLGSPFAGWVLGVHWWGLVGWRWLFILEGIPAIVFGVITWFYLTDWPHQANWLAPDEQRWITGHLRREKEAKAGISPVSVWEALRKREVVLLALVYFFAVTGFYAYVIWLPTILKRATNLPNFTVTVLAALPYLAALVAMLVNGWHSDRTGERRWHTAAPLLVAGVFLAVALVARTSLWLGYVSMIAVAVGTMAFWPSFWALPTAFLNESAAAASIGLINSFGNLGGFVGPFVVGYLATATKSFTSGLEFLLASLWLAGVTVLTLRPARARTARSH